MNKAIFFDMDGTIADLYGVDGWLDDLRAERVRPYAEAKPLVNLSRLARRLNQLIADGYSVNIISWTSRGGSAEYNKAVAATKLEWLARHMPSVKWDNVFIIPYGTPKSTCGHGVLFDDEKPNRDEWGAGAFKPEKIFEILGILRGL